MNPNLQKGLDQLGIDYDEGQKIKNGCRIYDLISLASLDSTNQKNNRPTKVWELDLSRQADFLAALAVPETYHSMVISVGLVIEKTMTYNNDRLGHLYIDWGMGSGEETVVMQFTCLDRVPKTEAFQLGDITENGTEEEILYVGSESFEDIKVIVDAFMGDSERWQKTLAENPNTKIQQ